MRAFLPTTTISAAELIAQIERHALDTQPVAARPIFGQIDTVAWQQIRGLSRFWESTTTPSMAVPGLLARCGTDLLTGLHGSGAPFALLFYMLSDGILHIAIGMPAEFSNLLVWTLQGVFPGIMLTAHEPKLGTMLSDAGLFANSGHITGIPTLKVVSTGTQRPGIPSGEVPIQQIERIIRGMGRRPWGYYLRATPVAVSEVLAWREGTLQVIRAYDEQAGITVQRTDTKITRGDREAQRCVTLLEQQLERLDRGRAQGMWCVEGHFFTPHAERIGQLAGLLRATFAGDVSRLEPFRTHIHVPDASKGTPDMLQTILHTDELAAFVQLPTEELPGYQLRDYIRFDVDLSSATQRQLPVSDTSTPAQIIEFAEVVDHHLRTGQRFGVPPADLTKHGLVVGVTGSGKTKTCFKLLTSVWDAGRGQPFLVIEPAKAEYRNLLPVIGRQLRIYTLGDERYAPFRLNPFEFECQDSENRIHVQTHMDYLKSVFNAAFVLYPPMPYVLEMCLHQVYQDCGWNLTMSTIDRRLSVEKRGCEAEYPVFPTLHDLYLKIDPVVDRLGYDARVSQDVKAGLKARIGSLLIGGKGLMLNTRRSLAMDDLLNKPTVLELERMGDDDEKAFLIGLLLTRIYEYRVVEGRKPTANDGDLRHVVLIEEAHRLLQNVPIIQSTDSANPRGKAVESFANMLAEIRGYGQGMLIAEQLPTKLAPDAIKNTNLKILHRMVAADERALMAGTMNLDETQTRAITTLTPGRAAVYAENVGRPYLVEVDLIEGTRKVADGEVRTAMHEAGMFPDSIYQPRPGCEQCRLWETDQNRCAMIRDRALGAQGHPDLYERYRRYTLSLMETSEKSLPRYPDLLEAIEQAVSPIGDHDMADVALCIVVHLSAQHIESLGQHAEMRYDDLTELHTTLLSVLVPLSKGFQPDQESTAQLMQQILPQTKYYADLRRALTARRQGPLAGCVACKRKCHYGHDVAPLIRDSDVQNRFRSIDRAATSEEDMRDGLVELSREVVNRGLYDYNQQALNAAALCFTVQVVGSQTLSNDWQTKIVRSVAKVLSVE